MNCDSELEILTTKIPCLKYNRNVNEGVIGWVPQKAGSEMERMLIRKCSWDQEQWKGREESGIGQREKLSCAMWKKHLANLLGCSKAGLAAQSCPGLRERDWAFNPCISQLLNTGCPRNSMWHWVRWLSLAKILSEENWMLQAICWQYF